MMSVTSVVCEIVSVFVLFTGRYKVVIFKKGYVTKNVIHFP